MIPLYDDNPRQSRSLVVYGLILLNCLIFFYQAGLPDLRLEIFIQRWAFIPSEFFRSPLAVGWSIVTAQFLHGSWLHLLGNMWFLWVFGRSIEGILSSGGFLVFYLLTGTAALLAQGFAAPGSAIPLIGASGAIAGIMGGYIVRFPRAKINTVVVLIVFITLVRIPALVFLGFWFAIETVRAATTNPGMPGVANLAHAAGFALGMILMGLIKNKGELDQS
jgi:membrane associated rhomboid family serine protease